nr:4-coumarate--CoA ligase 5-like [Procambarus clarkii]
MFLARWFGRGPTSVHRVASWKPSMVPAASSIQPSARPSHSSPVYQPTNREKNVVYSPTPPMELPQQDLHSLIFARALKWADKDAIECGITGRKYTYGNLVDLSLRWAGVVSQVMVSPESKKRLTIFCTNAPEFFILLLGTVAAGATVTTLSSQYTVDEVARQLANSQTEMVVTDPKHEDVLMAALTKLRKTLPVFVNGDSAHGHPNVRHILADSSKPCVEPVQCPLKSTAVIIYSSGTTGPPKGAELSHGAFTSNITCFTHPDYFSYLPTTAETQETVVGYMPFYHLYGLYTVGMFSLYLGAKIVSLPAFTSQDFVRIVRDHKLRVVHLVPPILNFLNVSPTVTSEDLSRVRVVMCAGAPIPTTSAEALKKKAPNPIFFQEGFGMTECLGALMTPLKEEKIGWCGKCVPNVEVKVVDVETGLALPENQRGELCIRSPSLMTGYLDNPTATAETIDKDGYLHTGDVAIHQDGFVSIVDRIKELIKVKGLQVSPSEIEDLLLQHPGVIDAAVVGVDDERSGELPCAFIVRRDGTSEEDIHKFLQPKVAEYKQLKGGIKFVDALPKSATGKVLKKDLKEKAAKRS